MRVHFVGNSQASRLLAMFQRSVPGSRASLTLVAPDRPGSDPRPAFEAADIVILQVGTDPAPGLAPETVRGATAAEVIALPGIFLDGIASLEREGASEAAPLLGEAELLAGARGLDRPGALRRFLAGEIDMGQEARLARSLARMRAVEAAACDIRISDMIEDSLRASPVVYGASAPTQTVLFRLFERLCDYLGIEPDAGMAWDPAFCGSLALPRSLRAFTPWDVRALGLAYEADSHWHAQAVTLVHRALRAADERRADPEPEALSA